jgi:hypothetical protein
VNAADADRRGADKNPLSIDESIASIKQILSE